MDHKKGKIYYSMGEVAEMFDVNASLIRFWESKFDILKPHKNKKGNRMFTPADVDNLKLIHHLVKEKGMTLVGAQKRLKENPEGTSRDMEITDRLLSIRAILMELRQELGVNDGEIYRATDDRYEEEPAAARAVRPTRSAASAQIEADEEWLDKELADFDRLSGEISDLSEKAGISEKEADELIENKGELPLGGEAGERAGDDNDAGDSGFGADITDEDLELLGSDEDDHIILESSAPDGIDNVWEPSLFGNEDFMSTTADTARPAKEEPAKPQIIEQTLF